MTTTLTAEAVETTFDACVADVGIEVEGIVHSATFDKAKLADHAELIASLLYELPVQFRASGGGGWSFLNACDDRHGNQWTGLHRTMERLFMLGMAAGLVESQLPRDMWEILPGGMPYYVVKDAGPVCTGERYPINPDAPEEGTDVRHDGECPVHEVPA